MTVKTRNRQLFSDNFPEWFSLDKTRKLCYNLIAAYRGNSLLNGRVTVMLRVAVCDDNAFDRAGLSELLDQYRTQRDMAMEIELFGSPLDLLGAIDRSSHFDALLMDILMPGVNGIEAASEIRQSDKCVKIIFLTSSAEFAVQSYTVNAFYYLLKPIKKEALFPIMDSVCETCGQERANSIVLRCADGFTAVEIKKIEFCEVIHRTLFIHMTSVKVLETGGSMDNFEEKLSEYGHFIRIHRSYLVNLNHILNVSGRCVTMSDMTQIPIPKGKYNEIKNAFLENAFNEGKTE